MVELDEKRLAAAAAVLLSRVNAPEQEIYSATRAALRAYLEAAGLCGWRPIESAPKDNPEWVFLYVPGHGPARAIWRRKNKWWESHATGREITSATHWRPLPPAPQGGRDE